MSEVQRMRIQLEVDGLKSALASLPARMKLAEAAEQDTLTAQIAAAEKRLAKLGGPSGGKPNG